MRILTRSEIERAIGMPEALEAARLAFTQLASGRAHVPLRTPLHLPEHEALALFMPAALEGTQALGCKLVTVYPHNREHALPSIHALVLLLDPNTGRPLAVLEGACLTTIRTGAASGVATELLARPEARVLACFGAGEQAFWQVKSICTVRPIERVWVRSRTEASAQRLIERLMQDRGVPRDLRAARTQEEAVCEADVICTATTSSTPVFEGRLLRPGTHINAIGSYSATMQELDTDAVRQARIVVDSRAACQAEAGDLAVPLAAGLIGGPETWTELGEILLGRAARRTSPEEITLFKSVGNAAQDLALAERALREAERLQLGTEIDMFS